MVSIDLYRSREPRRGYSASPEYQLDYLDYYYYYYSQDCKDERDGKKVGGGRMRRRLVEVAKRERARGRNVILTNKELWVEGRKWRWDESGKSCVEERGE